MEWSYGRSNNHEAYETIRRQQGRPSYIGIGYNIFCIAFRDEYVKYDAKKRVSPNFDYAYRLGFSERFQGIEQYSYHKKKSSVLVCCSFFFF